jgi:hypothetical protein
MAKSKSIAITSKGKKYATAFIFYSELGWVASVSTVLGDSKTIGKGQEDLTEEQATKLVERLANEWSEEQRKKGLI